ncbi:MAG: hypothetical protein E7467_04260 [Ruminococcaceae bacterium]|nr:hypothetical protein [Oscillospiraceae bacterium]
MNEALIEQIVDEVRRRQCLPNALLLGRKPTQETGFHYVTEGDYSAIVIGSLSAHELLQFPNEAVTEALLAGKAVYLCEEGLDYRSHSRSANRVLWSKLLSCERQLKQFGVQFLGIKQQRLVTADEVRRLLREGQPIHGRLTPLAKDVLEGKT